MMTSEGKPKGQAARKDTGRRALERLKPEEAAGVLRHLLEVHPDLATEAEEMARSLLHQVDYEDVAAEIEDEIRALDYEDLNARAGRHEWGYVEPSEAAEEILEETVQPYREDMKRHLELGLEAEALEICKGLVLGCYRLSERAGGDVLEWGAFPGGGGRCSGGLVYRNRPPQEPCGATKKTPSTSCGLPKSGSQVDSHDRAYRERKEVSPASGHRATDAGF